MPFGEAGPAEALDRMTMCFGGLGGSAAGRRKMLKCPEIEKHPDPVGGPDAEIKDEITERCQRRSCSKPARPSW